MAKQRVRGCQVRRAAPAVQLRWSGSRGLVLSEPGAVATGSSEPRILIAMFTTDPVATAPGSDLPFTERGAAAADKTLKLRMAVRQ